MKRLKLIASLFAAALLCGCATSHIHTEFTPGMKADGEDPVAVVVAENYGYYLFGIFPLIAGNPDKANDVSLTVFDDTVTLENNQKMIISALDSLDTPYRITDMRDSTDWTGGFSLWIIWKQVLSSNAVAIKAVTATETPTSSETKTAALSSPSESN